MKINEGKKPVPFTGSLGEISQVIPCLNTSWTYRDENNRIQFVKRWYSIKQKQGKAFKLIGHSQAIHMSNVTFKVQAGARDKVRQTNRKSPHAFLVGTVTSLEFDESTIQSLKAQGWVHISYDPYKTDNFVICGQDEHLPKDAKQANALPIITECKELIAYSNGVLVRL